LKNNFFNAKGALALWYRWLRYYRQIHHHHIYICCERWTENRVAR